MKLKNVKIGMKVQVKHNANIISNWYDCSVDAVGVVVGVDSSGHPCSVQIEYEDERKEWGNHKGLRKVNSEKESL